MSVSNEGVELAKRLVTMKLTDFTPDQMVEEIIDSQEHAPQAIMFLASLAAKKLSLEVWQESLLKEQSDGI